MPIHFELSVENEFLLKSSLDICPLTSVNSFSMLCELLDWSSLYFEMLLKVKLSLNCKEVSLLSRGSSQLISYEPDLGIRFFNFVFDPGFIVSIFIEQLFFFKYVDYIITLKYINSKYRLINLNKVINLTCMRGAITQNELKSIKMFESVIEIACINKCIQINHLITKNSLN